MMQLLYFFFNDTATTEIYTLSLHDALPIFQNVPVFITLQNNLLSIAMDPAATENHFGPTPINGMILAPEHLQEISSRLDRKSTRLNSSHANISYAVFCLKKIK